jgi:hypothetical protein
MIPVVGFEDYFVDGSDIVSMKCGGRKVLSQSLDKDGYKNVNLYRYGKYTTCKVHRLIAQAYLSDYSENLHIDHIDRNPLNNNICNLRMATRSENMQNRNAKGCSFNKRANKWLARIIINKKYIHLGYFDTESEARAAYLEAKKIHHPTSPINQAL